MKVPAYRRVICGSIIASNLDLRELRQAPADFIPKFVFLLDPPRPPPAISDWYHHFDNPDGTRWLTLARLERETLLRFPSQADFLLSSSRRSVVCTPHTEGISAATIRHLFLDHVFPLLLSTHGQLVLHASATVLRNQALIFLGVSGAGKSTIAAAFAQHANSILNDDCTVINFDQPDTPRAMPYYPGLRLWQDSFDALFPNATSEEVESHSLKKRVSAFILAEDPAPVARIFLLGPSKNSRIHIDPVPARDALIEIVRFAFLLNPDQPAALQAEFEKAQQLASLPIFYKLSMPRSLDSVAALPALLLEHLTPSPW